MIPPPAWCAGLGDIAVPALVVSMLLLHDYRAATAGRGPTPERGALPGGSGSCGPGLGALLSRGSWARSYALCSWVGYSLGLVMTLAAAVLSDAAQPALLYLAPCTLAPPLALAAARGDWARMWSPKAMPPGGAANKELDV